MQKTNSIWLHKTDLIEGRMQCLSRVSLFADFKENKPALRVFAEGIVERSYSPGTNIIEEGMTSSEMYILISGRVNILRRTPDGDQFRVVILEASENSYFGEAALLDTEVRSATVSAETECLCFIFEKKQFEEFSIVHPEWALPFYRKIACITLQRLRKSNTDLMYLYRALVHEVRGS